MPDDRPAISPRILPATFAGDDGSADPVLAAALALPHDDPERLPRTLAALHRARVLAPVVALASEVEATDAGLVRDRSAEIAVPLLLDDHEQRALPVFSDLVALARWDPTARPVPVEGVRAAQVALAEGAQAMVLDVAGPRAATIDLPELHALVTGRGSVVAWEDPDLAAELAALLERFPAARAATLTAFPGRDAQLVVTLAPDGTPAAEAVVDRDELAALALRLGAVVRGRPSAAREVRGIEVALRIKHFPPYAPG